MSCVNAITIVVSIHGILLDKVRVAISRLCFVFNAICSKVVDPQQLDDLENKVAIVLCQMEMYFPPSFFNIMVNLIVHVVREIRMCGPVFLRWMYPIERYMKVLKRYTKNLHRPSPKLRLSKGMLLKSVLSFAPSTLNLLNPSAFPKVVMVGHRGVRVHEDSKLSQ